MEKDRALVRIIEVENPSSAFIFCNTKTNVHYVTVVLQRFGYDADELSADRSQADRERILKRVRAGTLRFLVATDVASRGLDIPELSHVIQYEPPEDAEDYIHRAGRTGRAGAAGVALSLVSEAETLSIDQIAKRYKRRVPAAARADRRRRGERGRRAPHRAARGPAAGPGRAEGRAEPPLHRPGQVNSLRTRTSRRSSRCCSTTATSSRCTRRPASRPTRPRPQPRPRWSASPRVARARIREGAPGVARAAPGAAPAPAASGTMREGRSAGRPPTRRVPGRASNGHSGC